MPSPVKIMAVLTARPGKAEALGALLAGMVEPCRGEPGNLRWDIWRDQAEPGRFILDELYADNAAVAAHRETAHFKAYFARINDLAERQPYVLDAVAVG
ncbi:MAG: antibiotic biosynthesis monooxygenase [Phenylobacterium sp.]|uniref:putative quinol monooxygenase n=1 Tax=Phenylobacterium sp. TaxID=1871053 RepID=UPI001A417EAD|nr:putative quinol monooxygenase [Phenylobacterium sp.]MBL8555637.1 antibiotic biosynthesis monooxygenase [Phenylobacterium sp.]